MNRKIIIALDVSSSDDALRLVKQLHDLVGMFKVGSQLYMAAGAPVVREIIENGGRVFLDLKFHDIPNTVTHAAVEAGRLGVSMMTIHASGGRAMMQAVAQELTTQFGRSRPRVVAVTVLTSFDAGGVAEIGISESISDHVQRLARLAQDSGVDGVVCSPHEIKTLRDAVK